MRRRLQPAATRAAAVTAAVRLTALAAAAAAAAGIARSSSSSSGAAPHAADLLHTNDCAAPEQASQWQPACKTDRLAQRGGQTWPRDSQHGRCGVIQRSAQSSVRDVSTTVLRHPVYCVSWRRLTQPSRHSLGGRCGHTLTSITSSRHPSYNNNR